jgi:hypothetical protein
MTDLTGFILEEIAGSSSSETSNIVQVVAVTAAWQKDMMETLLRYHQLQAKLLAAAIAIGAIRNQSVPRRIAYTPGHFDLFAHDDEWCVEFLRFTRRQIVEMAMLLDIPSQFGDGYEANPTTALSLVLFRLSWPKRLKDIMSLFGHQRGWLSRVFNVTCQHIYRRFQSMLRWSDRNLTQHRLSQYCEKIHERGEPSRLVWGFVDGTVKPICKPGPYSAKQKNLYCKHKHVHGMKFLAVVTPDGLISCLAGPYEGRKSDWGMWIDRRDGLQDLVVNKARGEQDERLYVFGDKGFFMEEGIIAAYRRNAGIPLSMDELRFNAYMARQRIAVEWGFGKVMQLFRFCDLKINMKYGLSPISPYYFTSAVLANCHTCYYGSQTTKTFDCPPPSVREYFGCTEEKAREIDDLLQDLTKAKCI